MAPPPFSAPRFRLQHMRAEVDRRGGAGRAARAAIVLSLTALLVAAEPVACQEVSGRLIGRVVDTDAEAVGDVTVTVEGVALAGFDRSTTTGPDGTFRMSGLPVGDVRVRFERIGLRPLVLTDVRVRLGGTTSLGQVVLELEAVELAPVVVRARPTLIDPTSSSIGVGLSIEEVQHLPIGRDYKSIVQILSQANQSFLGDPVNVAGSTGLENMYYIDGVNVTDVYRGRTGTDLPYNFVDAVEVQQGGYEAEHGQALGGLVNVVTRSGTSEFEWGVVGFFSGSGLASSAKPIPNVLARSNFSDLDMGLSASGPVAGETVTFFAAYNPRFTREEIELPGLGIEEATLTQHMFAGKLSWQPSTRTDVYLSVFGDPTSERRVSPAPGVTLVNADPILTTASEGGINASLRWLTRLSDRFELDGVLSRHARSEDAQGATELGRSDPSFIDRRNVPKILLSGGNGTDQELTSSRTSAKGSATLLRGDHTFKAGFELQLNRLDVANHENPGQVAWLADDLYRASIFIQDFSVENRVVSLFVQDGWATSDRLRFNYGLRWDAQYLIDQNGDVGQSITDQFQPRIGVVYRLDRNGRSKIFGHAGRFYQQLALLWSTIGLAGFDQRQEFSSVDPRQAPGPADSTLVISDPDEIRGGTDGLRGEHHDEFVLGYDQQVSDHVALGVRGTHRILRESITAAFRPDRDFAGGNPGRAPLDHLPRSERRYSAVDLSLRVEALHFSVLASYVLSKNEGNYPGLFVAEGGGLRGGSLGPNNSQLTYFPAQSVNSSGPLPNDRPHVFKVAASYALTSELRVGTFFTAQSGVPLSQLGRVSSGFNAPLFLTPRGSEGRTPSTWDLSLRLGYELPAVGGRLILDLMHIGNPQSVVNVDQRRFNGAQGSPFANYEQLVANQRGESPGYGTPVAFQEPFRLRIGFELAR